MDRMVCYLAGLLPVGARGNSLFHRYVLHGAFPPGKGLIRRFFTNGSNLFIGKP